MQSMTADAVRPGMLSLRDIAPEDASACHHLSRQVGWAHRIEDWQAMIELGGGVVATLDGEIVGSALFWTFGTSHASLGMIIVDPRHQGAGIGTRLMQRLLKKTHGRVLQLNATLAGQPLYERLGFVPCGTVRPYSGQVVTEPVLAEHPDESFQLAEAADLHALSDLDRKATGLDRADILKALLSAEACVALKRDGSPVGFSVLRPFGRHHVIGPVVAATESDARKLIAYWLKRQVGRPVRVDLIEGSGLGSWISDFGLEPAGSVTTMVRGDAPMMDGSARTYAVISQALG